MNDLLLRKSILVGAAIVSVATGSYLALRPNTDPDSPEAIDRALSKVKPVPRSEYDWADSKRRLTKIANAIRLYQQEYGIGEPETWNSMSDLRLPSGLETLTRFPDKAWALKAEDLRPSMTFHQFNSLFPTQFTIVHNVCSEFGTYPCWKPEVHNIVRSRKGEFPIVLDLNGWTVDEYDSATEPLDILVIRQNGNVEITTISGGGTAGAMDLLRNR